MCDTTRLMRRSAVAVSGSTPGSRGPTLTDENPRAPRVSRFAQHLEVEQCWQMVPLAEALQSLELVHGLKELTVDRRPIAHEW